ncbi:MAG: Glycoside hydrolase, 38 vacuolar alpha mannosidase [Geoglossum umbratile]|nr:MAG: Glycoside hydrolase, 38 vacuolar alpha mannosidase [Geoglossum umbratile]
MGGETQEKPASQYPKLSAGPVGQQIWNIYKDRLGQFTGDGQYERNNLLSMMEDGRSRGGDSVKLKVYSVPDLARPSFKEATSKDKEYKCTEVGESFGPSWSTHWFHITLTVPPDLRKKDHLEFHWDAGNEGMVWTEEGEPLQGLTGGDRIEWIFPQPWKDGKEHVFYIEMACNKMFGNAPGGDGIQPPIPDSRYGLNKADIVAINLDARQLFVDFWIIKDAAQEFPDNSWESHEALQVANAIIDAFVPGDLSSVRKGREIAKKYLGNDIDSEKVYQNDSQPLVYGIGHCHIDTCWLWPWAETKRKVARSWANQCDLLDRYPEHRFVASQAQQYKWLEQNYPSLFDRVKAKVKKGTFHPIGGSWVEHDTNMPSGESLVRQFIYGQRFFESHFGERCTTFWLPDTFGYSGQLPQICRLAGMSRFLTQKLSWNNINKFPHTTFNWVALDGSQVLCHMPPSETYTADAHFGDVKRSIQQHKSMDQDATSLLVFGKGDGGGGPVFQHIEKLRRCRGLSDKIGLLPRVKMGESVDDFFERLEKKAESGTKYVTWYGELYFELHRGTYTTQANNKLGNRKSEVLLHDIEFLATLASLSSDAKGGKSSYKYPKSDIDDLWEMVLLCQFHDCLPGSSIRMCYDDSDKVYAEIDTRGGKLIKDALSALGFHDKESEGTSLWAVNTLPWHREEIMELPPSWPAATARTYALVKGNQFVTPNEPSIKRVASEHPATVREVRKGVFQLENSHYRVEVTNGYITSLVDLSIDREIIPSGAKANQFVIFDDKPLYWQAWDVEVYHLETRKELQSGKTKITEERPHKVSVVTETKISEKSWVKTTVSLAASGSGGPSYIEIHSEVEWRETMKFLKVEFPVDVRNTEASYESQFGIIRRPTHYNTSWDMAKFEVCCHKWADLSENDYGVSILNDSKYGFATVGNVMRLSLLRAPKAPDADADMGRHHIRYAILPHRGPVGSAVVRTAANFNNPMRFGYRPTDSPYPSLLNSINLTGSPSLVLDTVKRGEDDEDVSRGEFAKRKGRSIILRIYDSLGGKNRGVIKTTLPVKKAWKTNVLEDDLEEVKVEKGEIKIELRPFEVATFRLQL